VLNRIAVTNPSTDKRTPNTQAVQQPATPDVIEHSQNAIMATARHMT
jgi:hypothetical protein